MNLGLEDILAAVGKVGGGKVLNSGECFYRVNSYKIRSLSSLKLHKAPTACDFSQRKSFSAFSVLQRNSPVINPHRLI